MNTVRCWYIHRHYERPEGIDQYDVAASEVKKVRKPNTVKGEPTGGSFILLKAGGIAYCHSTPQEVAELLGLRPVRKN